MLRHRWIRVTGIEENQEDPGKTKILAQTAASWTGRIGHMYEVVHFKEDFITGSQIKVGDTFVLRPSFFWTALTQNRSGYYVRRPLLPFMNPFQGKPMNACV